MQGEYPFTPEEQARIYQDLGLIAEAEAQQEFIVNRGVTLGLTAVGASFTSSVLLLNVLTDHEDANAVTLAAGGGVAAMALGMLAGFYAGRGHRRNLYIDAYDAKAKEIIGGRTSLEEFNYQLDQEDKRRKESGNKVVAAVVQEATTTVSRTAYGFSVFFGGAAGVLGGIYLNGLASNEQQLDVASKWFPICLGASALTAAAGRFIKRKGQDAVKPFFTEDQE